MLVSAQLLFLSAPLRKNLRTSCCNLLFTASVRTVAEANTDEAHVEAGSVPSGSLSCTGQSLPPPSCQLLTAHALSGSTVTALGSCSKIPPGLLKGHDVVASFCTILHLVPVYFKEEVQQRFLAEVLILSAQQTLLGCTCPVVATPVPSILAVWCIVSNRWPLPRQTLSVWG